MRKRQAGAAIVVLAVAAAALWWGVSTRTPQVGASEASAATAPTAGAEALPVSAPAAGSVAAATATDSLRGTEVDGAVHLDAAGNPIADRDLRRLFDYFLSRIGEQTPEQIRAALQGHLQAGHTPAAVAQVLRWYDAYVALEQEAVVLAQGTDARAAVTRLRALRRERMGEPIAEAFWGDEDRYLDYTLARRDIEADKTLTAAERAAKLAALDQTLPPERRAQVAQNDDVELAAAQSRDFEERRVPAADRFAEREQLYGCEAAQRLGELDAKRAQWQDRLHTYATQRQRILANPALTPAQRTQQINALLAREFDRNERRRVDVLIRNGLLPGS